MNNSNYPYGFCGMPCGLCTRYRISGPSKCQGCSCKGYYTDNCKVYRCCNETNKIHCGKCKKYPCSKLSNMKDFKDLNTNNVKKRTGDLIKNMEFANWYKEYNQKCELLTYALEKYNDGRMKRYLCELFINEDLTTLLNIMKNAKELSGDIKERASKFKAIVNDRVNSR